MSLTLLLHTVSPILKLPFIIIPTGVIFTFGRTQMCIVHLNAILQTDLLVLVTHPLIFTFFLCLGVIYEPYQQYFCFFTVLDKISLG